MMKIINATDARRQFFNLIKRSVKGHEEFRITHKDGDAILLSDEDKVVTLIASHIKIA
ncbi:MAG: type II toxin-antitoxin system Phd/YefM family antitoxin [Nitrospirota bacterium]